jgi:mono/diheme cytochrome c family protein
MKLNILTPIIGKQGIWVLLIFTFFLGPVRSFAQEGDAEAGAALFKNNCASCHHPLKRQTGPALKGASQRWADAGESDLFYDWVKNAGALLASGKSARAKEMESFDPSVMTPQAVNDSEIDDIVAYIESFVEPERPNGDDGCATPYLIEEKQSSGKWKWLLTIVCILSIVVFATAGVNRRLKEFSDEFETDEDQTYMEIAKDWLWKNKVLVSLLGLVLVLVALSDLGWRAAQIDVMEGYQPSQPIKFSHIIHSCKNEIDCKYCHSSVEKSKHAGIPSVNVCMNCHRSIQEGTYFNKEEIGKIHKHAGYSAEDNAYPDSVKRSPIKWNKVHNLPDHVYFNHSQHVSVAGIDCIQCHGDVKTFDAGKVASVGEINELEGTTKLTLPVLTMGWCIECHNETGVDLGKNDYYNEIHARLKKDPELLKKFKEDDKISVRELGGWECAKCHY